jgi:hypothetical protein
VADALHNVFGMRHESEVVTSTGTHVLFEYLHGFLA